MALNRYIVNKDVGFNSKVKMFVESNYPNALRTNVLPMNPAIATNGGESVLYEGTGILKKEKIVWGSTRMGSGRVVVR